MAEPPGDPAAIRNLASTLTALVAPARNASSSVSGAASRSPEVGQNALADFVDTHAAEVARALDRAGVEFTQASNALANLATQLARLQDQGRSLGATPALGDPAYATHASQLQSLRAQAQSARHAAARSLESSAGHTILTKGYHYQHWYQYPWSFAKGVGEGIGQLVGGVVNIVLHPVAFVEGIGTLGTRLVDDPGGTGAQIWDSVVDTKMMHEDFAKWLGYVAFNVASLFVGGAAVKGLSKAGDVAEAGKVATTAGEAGDLGKVAVGAGDIARITSDELATAKLHPVTKLPASTAIEHDGVIFTTDSSGRVVKVGGTFDQIVPSTPLNRNLAKSIRDMGGPTDDAGHLWAKSLGGPDTNFNLVPQDSQLNRYYEWRNLEERWKSMIKQGDHVDVEINLEYPGDSLRPQTFRVEWMVNGKDWHQDFFVNSPTGTAEGPLRIPPTGPVGGAMGPDADIFRGQP